MEINIGDCQLNIWHYLDKNGDYKTRFYNMTDPSIFLHIWSNFFRHMGSKS